MKVEIKDGMKFISKDGTHQFTCKKVHFYGGEEVWCAFNRSGSYLLEKLLFDGYIPQVNGKWINEDNEYVF